MEPNNIEQDFKQKLEQRRIQPSEMAWDRLDAMLSVAENKKPKKNKTWMYMAASLLVFLLVGALFLKQEKQGNGLENNQNGVVTTDSQPENVTQPAINTTTVVAPEVQEEVVVTEKKQEVIKTPKSKAAVIKEDKIIKVVPVQQQVAVTDAKEPQNIIQDKDAETLLASVSDNAAPKKRSTVKVDPNSLLSSVEGELTESYRSKTFQGVVKSFNTVKVAVANRNHE
ncbi:hypothetical protein AMR72_12740 [Flavobacterium psychrophilum]|nr:hypothetical protein AMR72_12740 [Flavobacterium psychrophilum]AOE53311.1 hypothetical protein ALW18_12730 [Flavobacterium psychrophilum]